MKEPCGLCYFVFVRHAVIIIYVERRVPLYIGEGVMDFPPQMREGREKKERKNEEESWKKYTIVTTFLLVYMSLFYPDTDDNHAVILPS